MSNGCLESDSHNSVFTNNYSLVEQLEKWVPREWKLLSSKWNCVFGIFHIKKFRIYSHSMFICSLEVSQQRAFAFLCNIPIQ